MPSDEYTGPWWNFPPLRNALLAGALSGLTFLLENFGGLAREIGIAGYLAAIPLGGWHWIREGIEELVHERIVGIEILMMFATFGAAALGLWDEAAALVVLYGAAEGLEELAYTRARSSIRSLLDLTPKKARLLVDGQERTVDAEQVRPEDIFVVRPGEGIVTDGIVAGGESSVNEAAITGESIPVEKALAQRSSPEVSMAKGHSQSRPRAPTRTTHCRESFI